MQWSYTITMILSLSIFIAGAIAVFRFNQIQSKYYPFIFLLWIGCVTEVISIYFAYRYRNNLAVSTIYTLLESVLLLWFFVKLGVFNNRRNLVYIIGALFVASWTIDNFWAGAFGLRYSFYFDVIYALCIVLLSIRAINNLLFTEGELLKDPTFLICIGLVIFFTYQIIQRMFGLYGLKDSSEFRANVQHILYVISCFTNLVFASAVLWMPKRRLFAFKF